MLKSKHVLQSFKKSVNSKSDNNKFNLKIHTNYTWPGKISIYSVQNILILEENNH